MWFPCHCGTTGFWILGKADCHAVQMVVAGMLNKQFWQATKNGYFCWVLAQI